MTHGTKCLSFHSLLAHVHQIRHCLMPSTTTTFPHHHWLSAKGHVLYCQYQVTPTGGQLCTLARQPQNETFTHGLCATECRSTLAVASVSPATGTTERRLLAFSLIFEWGQSSESLQPALCLHLGWLNCLYTHILAMCQNTGQLVLCFKISADL